MRPYPAHAGPVRFHVPNVLLRAALILPVLLLGSVPPLPAGTVQPPLRARVARDLASGGPSGSSTGTVAAILQVRPGADRGALQAALNRQGVHVRRGFHCIDGMLVDLPLAALDAVASLAQVEVISPDRPVTRMMAPASSHVAATTGATQVVASGVDGAGIGIAVVDTGIEENFPDLGGSAAETDRVVARIDLVEPGEGSSLDPRGHGTHVAALAAGDGRVGLSRGMNFTGVAPGAHLVDVRVLDAEGTGQVSTVVAGLDWILSHHETLGIRVVNLSLGAPPAESATTDPLCRAAARLVDAGLVVVAAAGNFGEVQGVRFYGGITAPGNERRVITVGAARSRGTDIRSDDSVAVFSSRGPALPDGIVKPDLVAPGQALISAEAPDNSLVLAHPEIHYDGSGTEWSYMVLSGTSVSAPLVAGAAALVLEANPSLTPEMVKAALMATSQRLDDASVLDQGAGLLNAEGAVRLAANLDPAAGRLPYGAPLRRAPAPAPVSELNGEQVVWSNGLLVNRIWLGGAALFDRRWPLHGPSLWSSALWERQPWQDGQWSEELFSLDARGRDTAGAPGKAAGEPLLGDAGWVSGLAPTGEEGSVVWASVAMSSGCESPGAAGDCTLLWGTGNSWESGIIWGDLQGQGIIWGDLQGQGIIWGDLQGQGIIWGDLRGQGIIWGDLQGQGIIWGDLQGQGIIWGDLQGQGIIWGDLRGQGIIWGDLQGQGIIWGDLQEQAILWGSSP
ncbi:MAG: S8 family peptidase [Acidobacteriota bacterium]